MARFRTGALLSLSFLAGGLASPRAEAQLELFDDLAVFESAFLRVTEVDFEDLPPDSASCEIGLPDVPPIPNPLRHAGVTFSDPSCLQTGFCSTPPCEADPDNPDSGNIVLALNPGGTIEFPVGTDGALLEIQGMGGAAFILQAVDGSGATAIVTGHGDRSAAKYVGFASESGIDRVVVGMPGDDFSPVVIGALLLASLPVGEPTFTRGDVDGSGTINVTDVLLLIRVVLGRLPARFRCDDALDVNDDGRADLSDAVGLLLYFFRDGEAPPEPFPGCGTDGTPAGGDGATCIQSSRFCHDAG